MEENKIKAINFIISDIQDSVTDVWEELMDEDKKAAIKRVDELIEKLRTLKNNLTETED